MCTKINTAEAVRFLSRDQSGGTRHPPPMRLPQLPTKHPRQNGLMDLLCAMQEADAACSMISACKGFCFYQYSLFLIHRRQGNRSLFNCVDLSEARFIVVDSGSMRDKLRTCFYLAMGNVNMKVLPSPSPADSIQMRPHCASTRARAIVKPIPLPPPA